MTSKMSNPLFLISGIALAVGTCIPTMLAFAEPNNASVGNQSGSGSTDLTMVWENPSAEYGGTTADDPYANPDGSDDDTWGDNLAFSAPSAINFVAKANGSLLAPSSSSISINNYSAFGIRVSSVQIEEKTGWNIVDDATEASGNANAVWGTIGPAGDLLNWADYDEKDDVSTPSAWNMKAIGSTSNADKVFLTAAGNVANLDLNLSTAQTFGTIHWYLMNGNAAMAAPTLPTSPVSGTDLTGDAASVSNLSLIGDYLRSGDADDTYIENAESLVGSTVNMTVNTESVQEGVKDQLKFRLVDVDPQRGLTFEAVDGVIQSRMGLEDERLESWGDSEVRYSMSHDYEGSIYTTYFKGTEIDQKAHSTSINSLTASSTIETVTDKYWIASLSNVYGEEIFTYNNMPSENEPRFDYYSTFTYDDVEAQSDGGDPIPAFQRNFVYDMSLFRDMGLTDEQIEGMIQEYDGYIEGDKIYISTGNWWLRTAVPVEIGQTYGPWICQSTVSMNVDRVYTPTVCVLPCFCL